MKPNSIAREREREGRREERRDEEMKKEKKYIDCARNPFAVASTACESRFRTVRAFYAILIMQTRKELTGKMHAGNNNAVDHANGGSEGEDNRGGNNNGVRVSPRPLTESVEVIRLTLMHCDRNGTRSQTVSSSFLEFGLPAIS